MNKILVLCLFIFLTGQYQINAQKFGHINSAVIIQEHPMIGTANTQLEAFQKELIDPLDLKARAFEAKYRTFLEETDSGSLSQVAAQTKQTELQSEQEALATEEQQVKFKVMQKREALLQPILAEVDSVIQVIGKEGNYSMIFDTSVAGALLFTDDGNDLTEAVRARLKK